MPTETDLLEKQRQQVEELYATIKKMHKEWHQSPTCISKRKPILEEIHTWTKSLLMDIKREIRSLND